ncbi:MAG: phosphate ABC transporter permease PstA [Caldilineales bacterium]
MAVNNKRPNGSFPEGDEFDRFVRRRQRVGKTWHGLFFAATLVGIIALAALLIDVVDDTFGYVAIQSNIPETTLVMEYNKVRMLNAPRTLASEDDQLLAQNIGARPTAIGFFGYRFYQKNAESLTLLSVDGVQPDEQTVESGEYLLARPLFVYTSDAIIAEKNQVAAFLFYYLNNVNQQIRDIGYFPVSEDTLTQAQDAWAEATGLTASTVENLYPVTGDVQAVGSSTVAPITQQMADEFARTEGQNVTLTVNSIGTDAGIRAFCLDREGDILDASRAMGAVDTDACAAKGRQPLEFHIANDGIPVVVSAENDFLTAVTTDQLKQIFTTADNWSDVDPSWPDRPILHFIPSGDSGTLDFFVANVFGTTLEEQDPADLIAMLSANISSGRLRALEADIPLANRTPEDLVALIRAEVVKPQGVGSWTLFESIFKRQEIAAEVAAIPGAELKFYSWLNWNFLTSPQSTDPYKAGINVAIWGSLWITIIAFLFAVPIGVGAAIYLQEYSTGKSRFDQIVETNINNLAGVPSIIYGMLGLAVFVRILAPITSGAIFGYGDPSTTNGRTILSGGLTLGVLILPLVIINAREAIRAVPQALREASFGLGATRWQTIWNHVLPNAVPGILTGVILAVSRAFGETAPLIVVGVATFIVVQPDSPFSKFTSMTAQIYQWTSRPQAEFRHLAAAGIIALLVLLLALNATAIILRNRYARREY